MGIAAMFITWRNLKFYLLILRHTHNQVMLPTY